jgi:hypothetical protein
MLFCHLLIYKPDVDDDVLGSDDKMQCNGHSARVFAETVPRFPYAS